MRSGNRLVGAEGWLGARELERLGLDVCRAGLDALVAS